MGAQMSGSEHRAAGAQGRQGAQYNWGSVRGREHSAARGWRRQGAQWLGGRHPGEKRPLQGCSRWTGVGSGSWGAVQVGSWGIAHGRDSANQSSPLILTA